MTTLEKVLILAGFAVAVFLVLVAIGRFIRKAADDPVVQTVVQDEEREP